MKGDDEPDQVHWRATKVVRGWSTCPVGGQAEGTGLAQHEEERGSGVPNSGLSTFHIQDANTTTTSYGNYQEDGARLFGVVHDRQTRDNRHKLKWKGLTRHKK